MEHAWENAFLASEALRDEIIREAEALYKSTGLTPSQLQARVAELEAAARYVRDNFKASEDAGYHTRDREFAISILTEALR